MLYVQVSVQCDCPCRKCNEWSPGEPDHASLTAAVMEDGSINLDICRSYGQDGWVLKKDSRTICPKCAGCSQP